MVNMAITIQNLKFVRHSVDCILNRFSIGLFLVKIDNEMQRWSTWQSRFKTRNSFAIQLFASLTDLQLDYFWWKYSMKYGVGAHNNNDWKLQNASANRFIPTQQDRFVPFDN
ncbi:hypothetical protein MHU86_1538 [Fragilaria crotonensis]|nr:hypothetical protein MHU86_1538 [Fragilaria crotonensis]